MSVQCATLPKIVFEKGELKDFITLFPSEVNFSQDSEKTLILRGDSAVITSGLLDGSIVQLYLKGCNEKYLVSLENFQDSSVKFVGEEITLELDSNACFAKLASELKKCQMEFNELTCHFSGEELDLANIDRIVKELKVKNLRLVLNDSQCTNFNSSSSFSNLDSLTIFGGSLNIEQISAIHPYRLVLNRKTHQISSFEWNSYIKNPSARLFEITFQKPLEMDENELLKDLEFKKMPEKGGKRAFFVKTENENIVVLMGTHKLVVERMGQESAVEVAKKVEVRMVELL